MIPKLIHYCWLSGDPFPNRIQQCIDSWKLRLPDYQFVLWDTKRFDIDSCVWTAQAFRNKKYAFAADYIRLYALYNYGGIYLDTDVEVVKPFDDLLSLPYFIGLDGQNKLEAAIIGCAPNSEWIYDCLRYYDNREFVEGGKVFDMQTLPIIMQEQIEQKRKIIYLKTKCVYDDCDNFLYTLPFSFFCSKRHDTGEVIQTISTYSIHHFAMSWQSPVARFLTRCKRVFVKVLGIKVSNYLINRLHLLKLKKKINSSI